MPTTYTHDLFGQKVYQKLPEEMKSLIRENGNIFRIGLLGPDILFYDLFDMEVINTGKRMHAREAAAFFENGMRRVRERGSRAALAYLLGFACHYILDSRCHPYVYQLEENKVITHTAVEKELDRYLMIKSGLDPYSYYPASVLRPKIRYARKIHKMIPEVSTEKIIKSLNGIRFYTKFMVYDDRGKRRFILGLLTKLAGKKRSEMVMDFFMTKEPVRGSQVPVAKLVKLFQEAEAEAPELLVELYRLAEASYPLSKRWHQTYNG